MKTQDYHTSILVNVSCAEAFKSINNVSAWWTIVFEGHAEKLNDIFTVRFGETFITIKIIELIPDKKIGWHVIDGYKHWLKDKKEWHNTKMSWEISARNNKTEILFTHIGLIPGMECYEICEKSWHFYINESLFKLLNEGKGAPELK
jgi:hypothetical protein